jgi:hypothetical protein
LCQRHDGGGIDWIALGAFAWDTSAEAARYHRLAAEYNVAIAHINHFATCRAVEGGHALHEGGRGERLPARG